MEDHCLMSLSHLFAVRCFNSLWFASRCSPSAILFSLTLKEISVERSVFLLEVYKCCLSRVAGTERCIPSSIYFGSLCSRCAATLTDFLSILDWILSLDSVAKRWKILLSGFSSGCSCLFIDSSKYFDFHLSVLECY